MKRCPYCGKEYPDDQAVCAVDASPLYSPTMASPPQNATASLPSAPPETLLPARFPVTPALVTLGVLALCLGAQQIPIPTLAKASGPDLPLPMANSIFVLGVRPLLSGFVLVEIAALLIPSWSRLRTGGRDGREKLRHASLLAGMLLAAGQALFVAAVFEKTVSIRYGGGFRILTVLILLGATASLIVLARIVDEGGLGGGFPILLLAFAIPQIIQPLRSAYSAFQHGAIAGSALQIEAFGLALLVAATLWFFSVYALPGNEPCDHPALVSRPACGVVPLRVTAVAVLFVTKCFTLQTGRTLVVPWQVYLVISLMAAIGLAWLFNIPERFGIVWKALSPAAPVRVPRLKPVMLECVLFIALAVMVETALTRVLGGSSRVPAAVSVILITGILTDVVRDWQVRIQGSRLVPVWEIHQVYAVPPTMRLLQASGLHPFAQGLRLRSLLQFFGPYVPILIRVPAGEAQAASVLLQRRWPVLDQ